MTQMESSSSLQFRHDRKNNRTFAVELPSIDRMQEDLAHLVAGTSQKIGIKHGVARVHPNDRFCKATGRAVASSNMRILQFTMKMAWVGEGEMDVVYESGKHQIHLYVYLESGRVRIVDVS